MVVTGAHILLYSGDPDADRAFFRDVLEFHSVDAGRGWLIFALPPAEMAIHPASGTFSQPHAGHPLLGAVLYFMCKDLRRAIQSLQAKSVACSEVTEEPWGIKTTLRLPIGGEVGLYQPTHATAIEP